MFNNIDYTCKFVELKKSVNRSTNSLDSLKKDKKSPSLLTQKSYLYISHGECPILVRPTKTFCRIFSTPVMLKMS